MTPWNHLPKVEEFRVSQHHCLPRVGTWGGNRTAYWTPPLPPGPPPSDIMLISSLELELPMHPLRDTIVDFTAKKVTQVYLAMERGTQHCQHNFATWLQVQALALQVWPHCHLWEKFFLQANYKCCSRSPALLLRSFLHCLFRFPDSRFPGRPWDCVFNWSCKPWRFRECVYAGGGEHIHSSHTHTHTHQGQPPTHAQYPPSVKSRLCESWCLLIWLYSRTLRSSTSPRGLFLSSHFI